MKKIILGVIATVVVVTVAGIFYACKEENTLTSNTSEKAIKKSYSHYSDKVLTNSILIREFPKKLREIGQRYINEGEKGYLCFSLASDRTNIRYGIITENMNADIYKYMTFHFEEIILYGSCDEWKEFDDLDKALDFAEQGMNDCCDITIYDIEKDGKKIWIVILEPNPTLALPPHDNIFKRSILISEFDYKLNTMQHRLEVLGEYAIFSINTDKDVIKYGYFTEENNRALYMFLSKFEKLSEEKQLMYATLKNKFCSTDIKKIRKFVKAELEKGYTVTITCHARAGVMTYTAASWEK